jgi:radical SAM superfamily enzyme YgiQ (UPF0313 family)
MKKPKLLIIVLFQNLIHEKPYYALTPAPPLPGILLAGMTPSIVEIEVLHEMVRPIDYETNADFIAISFMDYLAPHAFEIALKFRERGKQVIGGGKFVSTFPELVLPYFDSILVGEAQNVWHKMVEDLVSNNLKKIYHAGPLPSVKNIPPPRYDLVESKYTVPIVTETSRGCIHSCTYCQLNIKPIPFRTRPVKDVIRDLTSTQKLPWYKRKMAMILDNHFSGDLEHAKKLLKEIAKLNYWAIGFQYSMESLKNDEFIALLSKANCRMSFLGMESLNEKSLKAVQKKQNKVNEYKEFFDKLHRNGILTFVGLMFALEEDTKEYYEKLPDLLDKIGAAVILPSITVPIFGTPLYNQLNAEHRIYDYDLSHYDGDHLVFKHKNLSEDDICSAYRRVNKLFYSPKKIFMRWIKLMSQQSIQEGIAKFILKLIIITIIYYKLSIFQRHHAKKRVFNKFNKVKNDNTANGKDQSSLYKFIPGFMNGNNIFR